MSHLAISPFAMTCFMLKRRRRGMHHSHQDPKHVGEEPVTVTLRFEVRLEPYKVPMGQVW